MKRQYFLSSNVTRTCVLKKNYHDSKLTSWPRSFKQKLLKTQSMGILRQNIRETGHFKDLVINTSIREGEKPSNITG